MNVFDLEAVTKRYGRRDALRGFDLSLAPGEALGLLGPNGAGKTSAIRLLLGFSKPTQGIVRLRGLSPFDPASRVGVGYLPERVQLPARMTVRSLLAHHAALIGLRGADAAREVSGALDQTGLAQRADERIGSLSKGLMQRVGFAQAFLGRPELILFDGHFPGQPIVPGVAQLAWIERYGKLFFAIEQPFLMMEVIKFKKIIQPNARLTMNLEWKSASGKLYFELVSATDSHSSGRMVYGIGQ